MPEGSHREVVITTRIQVDKSSAQTALRETVKAVAAQQKAADQAASQSAKAQVKAVRDAEREKLKELNATNKRTVAILKQQEKEAIASEKAKQKAIDETNKRTIAGLKQQEAAAKQAETAGKKAHAEYVRAQARIASANTRVAESFKQSLSGAMSLGRGVAMLGIVGEKDVEKLLRGLVRIQAAFDIMRGSVELIQAGARAWRGYRDAVAAAAVAQSAMGVAGVGGAGRLGLALGGIGAVATGVGIPLAVAGYFLHKAEVGTFSNEKRGRASMAARLSGLEKGSEAARPEVTYALSLARIRQESRESSTASRQFGREGTAAELLANAARMRDAKAGLTDAAATRAKGQAAWQRYATSMGNGRSDDESRARSEAYFVAARQQQIEALKEMKRLTEERGQLEIRAARETGRQLQDNLLTSQRELETAKEKVRIAQEQYGSVKQRFGAMDAREQRRAIGLKQRLDAGGRLTLDQLRFLQGAGGQATTEAIGGIYERRAEAAGFDRFFGSSERSAISSAQTEAAAAEKRLGGLTLKTEAVITHKIEADADAIARKLRPILQDFDRKMQQEMNTLAKQTYQQQVELNELRQASQETAGRGG